MARHYSKERWEAEYPYRVSLDLDEETYNLVLAEQKRVGYNVSRTAVIRETLRRCLMLIHCGPITAAEPPAEKRKTKALLARNPTPAERRDTAQRMVAELRGWRP